MSFWAHKGVRWITYGWGLFIAENVVLSHNRDQLIDEFGDTAYHGVYSALSTVACVSIGYGYWGHGRGQGPLLRHPLVTSTVGRACVAAMQAVGFVGLSQLFPRFQIPVAWTSTSAAPGTTSSSSSSTPSNMPGSAVPSPAASPSPPAFAFQARCPIDFHTDKQHADSVFGIQRVTRHPMLWSLALAGAGTALVSPFVTEVLMFGVFPSAFACIGSTHQDYRFRRGSGGTLTAAREAATSQFPCVVTLRVFVSRGVVSFAAVVGGDVCCLVIAM